MKEEAENLEALSILEEKLRHSVISRDWDSLDGTLREVKTMSEKVAQAEQIRAVVYQKIKRSCQAGPDEGFHELLSRVPGEERGNLGALHTRLRFAVEKVKCLTGGIDTYIRAAADTMDTILEEVLPDRRNRIYSRTGEALGSSRPLMASHSLLG
jgi:hypothetical protein